MIHQQFKNEASGHDALHIERVVQLSLELAEEEERPIDLEIIYLTALLHDIADWKFYEGDETIGPLKAEQWLHHINYPNNKIKQITKNIAGISFKGEAEEQLPLSLEGQIVQDADRLDAMGAVGIARTFAYGGFAGHLMYDPSIPPQRNMDKKAYQQQPSTTYNHFFEKLLLLKDRMNTPQARLKALTKHQRMLDFLAAFEEEMNIDSALFRE